MADRMTVWLLSGQGARSSGESDAALAPSKVFVEKRSKIGFENGVVHVML
jgi:hypothetical protein